MRMNAPAITACSSHRFEAGSCQQQSLVASPGTSPGLEVHVNPQSYEAQVRASSANLNELPCLGIFIFIYLFFLRFHAPRG